MSKDKKPPDVPEQLGFLPKPKARPFVRALGTSREAYSRSQPWASKSEAAILDLYRKNPGGLTCEQVEHMLVRADGLPAKHQTISPTLLKLRKKGFLVDSGRKRFTVSRLPAVVWVIPESRETA